VRTFCAVTCFFAKAGMQNTGGSVEDITWGTGISSAQVSRLLKQLEFHGHIKRTKRPGSTWLTQCLSAVKDGKASLRNEEGERSAKVRMQAGERVDAPIETAPLDISGEQMDVLDYSDFEGSYFPDHIEDFSINTGSAHYTCSKWTNQSATVAKYSVFRESGYNLVWWIAKYPFRHPKAETREMLKKIERELVKNTIVAVENDGEPRKSL
jgi:hypothetical protein